MTDSAQGRFVAQDADEFVFHPPEKEEGDPTEKKLRLLRDRFRRLLKGGDFSEQDHPRADDGKFGSGGGGASSEGKPGAGKKPAAKKPVQRTPEEVQVFAGKIKAAMQSGKLNAGHVAQIATALATLSVAQMQEVMKLTGIKASGPKAEVAQKIAQQAVARAKTATRPLLIPAAAITVVHPAADKLKASLEGAKNLTPEQQAKHAAAIDTVIRRMPRAALDRLAKNVSGVDWHATTKDLTASLSRTSKKVREVTARGAVVNGCYQSGDKKLILNGDVKRKAGNDVLRQDRENAHETYAHEMAHAIDGPGFEHSHSPEWVAAWKEEIGDTAPAAGQSPKLSKYATSVSHEGWAEFGRLVYGTGTDHAKIAKAFPKCAAYWKKIGVM